MFFKPNAEFLFCCSDTLCILSSIDKISGIKILNVNTVLTEIYDIGSLSILSPVLNSIILNVISVLVFYLFPKQFVDLPVDMENMNQQSIRHLLKHG